MTADFHGRSNSAYKHITAFETLPRQRSQTRFHQSITQPQSFFTSSNDVVSSIGIHSWRVTPVFQNNMLDELELLSVHRDKDISIDDVKSMKYH